MSGPTTSVVVCAYTLKRWDDLVAAVTSAAGQDPAPDELWLVVDHNEELLARARAELVPRVPSLRVVPNTRKQGLSGGRNTALELVGAEVVVFLDDDAQAEPGWLKALSEPYRDPNVIAVGGVAKPRWPQGHDRPVTLPAAPDAADSWASRGELDWVVGCTYAGQPLQTAEVRNLMGCNMSFRRSVFADLDGFSESLGRVGTIPLGCEETELCIRATARHPGSRILFVPEARIRHHVSEDRLTWSYLRRRCFAEGVSKAAVATMVAPGAALSTERTYTTRVLPGGVLREIGHARRGDRRGWSGAAAIVVGLAWTVAGYARGRVGTRGLPAPERAPIALAGTSSPDPG
ncbi:MAG: hypothetical protein JWP61_1929 [Friedmanniella sp.]|nr:hypothetical protein [Friedmanniella sp.]